MKVDVLYIKVLLYVSSNDSLLALINHRRLSVHLLH